MEQRAAAATAQAEGEPTEIETERADVAVPPRRISGEPPSDGALHRERRAAATISPKPIPPDSRPDGVSPVERRAAAQPSSASEPSGKPSAKELPPRERRRDWEPRIERRRPGRPEFPGPLQEEARLEVPSDIWIQGGESHEPVDYETDPSRLTESRDAFLAAASKAFASTLDAKTILRALVDLSVPAIADSAGVDVLTEDGRLKRLAAKHADPEKVPLVKALVQDYPHTAGDEHGPLRVIRTGETDFFELTDELIETRAADEAQAKLLREIGMRWVISVPLAAHGRVFGAMTLVYGESGRTYSDADRELIEDLGRRAGLALHNSWTVRELEYTKAELERKGSELQEATRRLNLHVEQTPVAAIDADPEGRIIAWNPAAERTFGYTADEAIGQPLGFTVSARERERFDANLETLLQRRETSTRSTSPNVAKDGRRIYCEWYTTALVDTDGRVLGVGALVEDITERMDMQRQAQRQMEKLNALRAIDLAITASMDLGVTLTVFLDQVVTQLGVDAADILLLNHFTQRLGYVAGRGHRTSNVQDTELLLGECAAGQAALDRRTVGLGNLETSNRFVRADLLAPEEFLSHYATPLVSKGKVVGVLEVFHRAPLHVDQEWIDFLEALAGQAAIAVDNTNLFEKLQTSNMELALAYDTTLEGWARALDLRDNVTEGHSRRVTEMTERLAKVVGIDDADLVHIRRGALLHDIGKMAIPDSILNKPGPLTEEEWAIMRKHPEYAYDLLSPIEYLRPSLPIPCAHHERWDGSGYPKGLSGTEIPLAARIFAIVDVWDALRSDRSYSRAWPLDRARDQIRGLAGNHLDPDLAEVFLGMEW